MAHDFYNGTLLQAALAAVDRTGASPAGNPGGDAREFLHASLAQERGRRRRRQRLAAALAALLIAVAAAAGVAFQQNRAARTSAQIASAQALTAKAGALRDSQPRTSLLLGVAAMTLHPSSDARASLLTTLTQSHYLGTLTGHHDQVTSVVFSPRAGLLASGSADGSVILWNPVSHHRVTTFRPTGHRIDSLAFNSDGKILAIGSVTTIVLWDMTDPGAHRVIARLPTGLRGSDEDAQVLFSPTAPILASSDGQELSSIWNISDPAAPRKLHGAMFTPAGPVYCMAFRPDGRQLAIGSQKSTIFLYRVTAQGDISRQGSVVYGDSLGAGISAVSYGPDGRTLAASSESAARLWNITTPGHTRRPAAGPAAGHLAR